MDWILLKLLITENNSVNKYLYCNCSTSFDTSWILGITQEYYSASVGIQAQRGQVHQGIWLPINQWMLDSLHANIIMTPRQTVKLHLHLDITATNYLSEKGKLDSWPTPHCTQNTQKCLPVRIITKCVPSPNVLWLTASLQLLSYYRILKVRWEEKWNTKYLLLMGFFSPLLPGERKPLRTTARVVKSSCSSSSRGRFARREWYSLV